MLLETTGTNEHIAKAVWSAEQLIKTQRLVRQIPVGESVVEAILKLVRSARPSSEGSNPGLSDMISWGPGPRASQALMMGARAKALMDGRLSPSIEDVITLAEPVLKHRMALSFSARAEGVTLPQIISQLTEKLD